MWRLLLPILFLMLSGVGYALDVPPLQARVNDTARILSPGTVQSLEQTLERFEREESTQIVVLTVPTLGGDPIEDFSIRVAESWRIGQKGKDNGAILIVVPQDRKVRIEVGRGLEGVLTDLVSSRIIRQHISPRFRAGDMDGGVMAGVSAIMAVVKGEYGPQRDLRQGRPGAPPVLTLLIFLVVACIFLGAVSRALGGVAGAVGLPLIAQLSFPGLGLLLLALLGAGGFALGLFLAFLFGSGGRGGFGGPFFGGGFGGPFGGGGGGGFGGGGFSGGGGDFGGGGASGDW